MTLPSHAANVATDDFVGYNDPRMWVKMHEFIANTGGANELPLAHPDVAPAFGVFDGVCPLYISAVDTEVRPTRAVYHRAREMRVVHRCGAHENWREPPRRRGTAEVPEVIDHRTPFAIRRSQVLRDDAVALAKTARRAGVSVKLSLARRGVHGLPIFAGSLPEAAEETALAARWLAEKLHPGFGDSM